MQDKCLTREKDEVAQIFQEEFGKSHTEIFVSFDEEPIAAASIAQVGNWFLYVRVYVYVLSKFDNETCMYH